MPRMPQNIRHSLVTKLIFAVGLTLLLTICAWAYFSIRDQKQKLMDRILAGTERLTTTIKLSTQYAMMRNSHDDLNQIVNNIAEQQGFENIRIYNKKGQIKFSNDPFEIDQTTNIKAEACDACHRTDPPMSELDPNERTRFFDSAQGTRLLGIISPIRNLPGCATGECHVHQKGKSILGALDIVVSLEKTDKEIVSASKGVIGLACFAFLFTSTIIYIFVLKFVNRPIKELIDGTKLIAKGEYTKKVDIQQDDEMGQLAAAINTMGQEIAGKQAELNRQRNEYQDLFERVPCLITVHDRNYKLIKYNREFAEKFDPEPDSYCYAAFKGRDKKCIYCPVEKTFQDGKPHYSEETGLNKDGTVTHWITRTSPIKNSEGEIIAAMEMSLDVTPSKELEEKLEISEKKYQAIFNNIPNPVFVLDFDTLNIIDCNHMVTTVYGYTEDEIINKSFLDLFDEDEKYQIPDIKSAMVINQAKHLTKQGTFIYVDIWISPSEYSGKKVLLVTTSDITKRLETEQQLIQASKMATLGEMATGVAHELNQPLSVIKTVSSFFIKKIKKNETIEADTLSSMLVKVDSNVDRASKIINHMRQFARKSEIDLERVQVNEILERTFEMFSQQLKVRGIELRWDVQDDLPKIMSDPGRLEQVFVNLLVNARDAIEKKWESTGSKSEDDKITIKTKAKRWSVVVEVRDTGVGIPDSIAEKIFEPFYTTKEVGKGTGLGLSISYGIIKECGGNIEIVPVMGEGACFVITFPITDPANTING
ncbi:MAG: PAS domain S-box protein [Deltaproteobacteria bacterium]|nr:PAS domain S-box protein [Deltaproteobacteria bacterium]